MNSNHTSNCPIGWDSVDTSNEDSATTPKVPQSPVSGGSAKGMTSNSKTQDTPGTYRLKGFDAEVYITPGIACPVRINGTPYAMDDVSPAGDRIYIMLEDWLQGHNVTSSKTAYEAVRRTLRLMYEAERLHGGF